MIAVTVKLFAPAALKNLSAIAGTDPFLLITNILFVSAVTVNKDFAVPAVEMTPSAAKLAGLSVPSSR